MNTATCPNCEARQVQRQPDEPLHGDQEAAIRGWLAQIGESDKTIIDDVLTVCRHDADARQYFLGLAGECAISGR